MADQVLACRECGNSFTFTQGEQEFYESKGLSKPSRCPDCRQARKRQREMSWNGSPFDPESLERRPRELFDVVCDSCGQPTQVPFKPRGVRPVYCRDCHRQLRP